MEDPPLTEEKEYAQEADDGGGEKDWRVGDDLQTLRVQQQSVCDGVTSKGRRGKATPSKQGTFGDLGSRLRESRTQNPAHKFISHKLEWN